MKCLLFFCFIGVETISPGSKNYLTEATISNRNIRDQATSNKYPVFCKQQRAIHIKQLKKHFLSDFYIGGFALTECSAILTRDRGIRDSPQLYSLQSSIEIFIIKQPAASNQRQATSIKQLKSKCQYFTNVPEFCPEFCQP